MNGDSNKRGRGCKMFFVVLGVFVFFFLTNSVSHVTTLK